MDVLNNKELKEHGYNPKNYYCGNYSFQRVWTLMRDHLKKWGVPFLYNPACFLHDLGYSKKPTIWQKVKIDFVFFKDMLRLLRHSESTNGIYKRLLFRAMVFYLLVTLMTPIYIFQKKIRTNGKQ